ncbi:hypothetical protein L2K20_22635 [Mycobacterium sp. MBM]|nr:hypothetical protein [Mycobacterium sp. MBM]
MVLTLRALAEVLGPDEDGVDPELGRPFIRYRSINEADSDSCMDWRADIVMWTSEGDEVLAGFVDFLTLKADSLPEGDSMLYLLDSISEEAASFSRFFEGGWVGPEIEDTVSAGHVEYIVILTYVFVESPLRGMQLGVWAISEVAHRMLPAHTGLLLMATSTSTVAPGETEVSKFQRKREARLGQYWCSAGLSQIDGHPGFLAGSPAFKTLGEAREALRGIGDVRRTLTTAELLSGEIDASTLDIE